MANITLKIRVPSSTRLLVSLVVDGQVDDVHKVELESELDLNEKAIDGAVSAAAKVFKVSAWSTQTERDETVAPALASATEKRRVKEEADTKAKTSANHRFRVAGGTIANTVRRICEQHHVSLHVDYGNVELHYTDSEGRHFRESVGLSYNYEKK